MFTTMTPATRTEIQHFAKQIADYVTFKCDGESEGFEIIHNGYIAFVNYEAEYRAVRGGDSCCGMWEMVPELVSEQTTVEAVWDGEGTGRPDDGRPVKYYDIEAAGWRSFKVENLVTIY